MKPHLGTFSLPHLFDKPHLCFNKNAVDKMKEVPKKKIIIVEKHFIIGAHIIQLLKQEGYEVYPEVVSTSEFLAICDSFNPDIIIINKNLFLNNYDLFHLEINLPYPPRVIVLYSMIPGEKPKFMLPDIEQIEKPFFSHEIRDMLKSIT